MLNPHCLLCLVSGYDQLDYSKYDQNEDHCDASDDYAGLIVGISQRFIHSQHTHHTQSSSLLSSSTPLSSSPSSYLGLATQSKPRSGNDLIDYDIKDDLTVKVAMLESIPRTWSTNNMDSFISTSKPFSFHLAMIK